jgi:hypothetical protein
VARRALMHRRITASGNGSRSVLATSTPITQVKDTGRLLEPHTVLRCCRSVSARHG